MRKQKVNLTNDPLENIRIMAPLLDKTSQEKVFIYTLGIYNGMSSEKEEHNAQLGDLKAV